MRPGSQCSMAAPTMHRKLLETLRSNARHYTVWRWPAGTERGARIDRINKAATEDELLEIVDDDGDSLRVFCLRYGFY